MGETQTDAEPYFDSGAVGNWLLARPSLEARVVGLLLRTGSVRAENRTDPAWVADQVTILLAETRDPGHLYLLAVTCLRAKIQSDCRRLGLDQAIVEYDQGNPLSRGLLIENAPRAWQALLLEESQPRDHVLAMAPMIRHQLEEYFNSTEAEFGRVEPAIHALAISWAFPLISFQQVFNQCRTASDALRSSCRIFADRVSAAPNTLGVRNIGLALRSELTDDPHEAAQIDQFKTELMSFSHCVYARLPEDYILESVSAETVDNWLNTNAELGEANALMHFNQKLELGCSAPTQAGIG